MIDIASALLDAIIDIGGIAFWTLLIGALIVFVRLKWIDNGLEEE